MGRGVNKQPLLSEGDGGENVADAMKAVTNETNVGVDGAEGILEDYCEI